MLYPEHLLPSKRKANLFEYCDKCYLIRYTNSKADMLDEDGHLNISNVPSIHFWKFSTNFIKCSPNHPLSSKTEDIYIKVNKPNCSEKYWNVDSNEILSTKDIDFDIIRTRGYFYLKILDFNNYSEPLVYNINNKFSILNNVEISLKVEHKPTIINFFHFHIKICPTKEKYEIPLNRSMERLIISIIRNKILKNYFLDLR